MSQKKSGWGLWMLGGLFLFFVLFRVFYQKGTKLLEGLYPWNWIALVLIVGLLCLYAFKATRK